ncbi:proline dehydrogenase family protein [Reichenbachiella agarivorans]|uniref:Proline dehydrogenase family protein n=1 Tax=Reichenbachiella agarivorans TaxID=2979464 RepID=A0ABY6CKZ6_9BACT|nr:proline dehydrogenase family protein [Reichenbachiella agarivorans]UXP31187.1 proline dehydrogenase family protein [Reichenbachiella agarivorans]
MNKISKVHFDDTEVAFNDKSDFDLKRMYFLFFTMNNPLIAKLGIWLTELALKIHLPIKFLVKKTIFAQFCGGESLKDSIKTVEKLGDSYIHTILDYSVEGESKEKVFDQNKVEIIQSLKLAQTTSNIPTGVMKLTGFVAFDLLVKKQARKEFTKEEQVRWDAFIQRVEEICQYAVDSEKYLFIDAEESWIQEPIDEIVNDLMKKHNKRTVYIFNTYQLYKKSSLDSLKAIHQKAKDEGFKVGAKLVRGAYMEKERERAREKDYPDPIQVDKAATDQAYDEALAYCVSHIKTISVCAGTHNEKSSQYLTQLMEERQIRKDDPRVFFAQLYGMSDNISYTLADLRYNVAKYVPYGPVKKVLPYLMRRAQENTSIAGQSSREFLLVKHEMKRRKRNNS